ncbi:MAG TPA: DUF1998 domain-containing protein [Firmicutes bacterium]|nr:DUF1998 domain-containing protein [Bacillota bacterium]
MQKRFEDGEVNVLSCSTTFEMGVDVGELEAVVLHNVPPEAANYIQRAGRAGRRSSSTAFTLTYAQRRSHDLAFYAKPEQMVAGSIRPPSISLENEKIVLRHLYAVALSWYFRRHKEQFKNLSRIDPIMPEEDPFAFVRELHRELSAHPAALLEALERVLPESMMERLKVREWGWVDEFASPDPEGNSLLYSIIDLLKEELELIEKTRESLIARRKPSDHLLRLKATLRERDVISFLSSGSALPKYGFPVDVVPLTIFSHVEEAKRLKLERDLRIAIGEYAPGSEIVAGGYVWTSYGLRHRANREWESRTYAVCSNCDTYTENLEVGNDEVKCSGCGKLLSGLARTYVIPKYGFVTKVNETLRHPTQRRPERGYTSRVYFSHFENPEPFSNQYDRSGSYLTPGGPVEWKVSSLGRLVVLNKGPRSQGYGICKKCGFGTIGNTTNDREHDTPWGDRCPNRYLTWLDLGHSFTTDVLQLTFPEPVLEDGFWLSLMYGLLEGAACVLGIVRDDIDGCVYITGDVTHPSLILFDDVPGGAGHVKRLANDATLKEVLEATLSRIESCACGEDTSCYGCLRNYYNQWCHDRLKRGPVVDYLRGLLGSK